MTNCTPAGTGGHHPDGPKANHALSVKLDHSNVATQSNNDYCLVKNFQIAIEKYYF